MTHPDAAAVPLTEVLTWIMDRLEERAEKRLSPTAACQRLGHSKGYISLTNSPWRIPGFGFRGTHFTEAEWSAWLHSPDSARRAQWDAISLAEREKRRNEWRKEA